MSKARNEARVIILGREKVRKTHLAKEKLNPKPYDKDEDGMGVTIFDIQQPSDKAGSIKI